MLHRQVNFFSRQQSLSDENIAQLHLKHLNLRPNALSDPLCLDQKDL